MALKTNSTSKITIFIKNVNEKLGLVIRKNWSRENTKDFLTNYAFLVSHYFAVSVAKSGLEIKVE